MRTRRLFYSASILIAVAALLPVSRAAAPSATALSLNARMARETPDMIHPEITALLGRLVSSGNSSQEAFFDLRNVPPAYRDLDRIRHWSDEQIDVWSDYLIRHGIELVPSVNMYEPVADQVAGWQRFAAKGVSIRHILFGGEFYLRQWFEGNPGNGMLGPVRIDDSLDDRFPPGPDVRYYLSMLDEYLPAFKAAFPEARLYIVACTFQDGGLFQRYRRIWRDKVAAYARRNPELVDGFRYHIYVGDYVSDVPPQEEAVDLSRVEEQIAALPLPIYVAEGGRRDVTWDAEGESRLWEYVLTVGRALRARGDGSIQGFHVVYTEWPPHRFPLGHPHPFCTREAIMHYYDPDTYQRDSDAVVLTPKGQWYVDRWEALFD